LRQRQLLPPDLLRCQSRTHVSLAHQGVTHHTFFFEKVPAKIPMAYVGVFSMASQIGAVGQKNSDVMEYGRFPYKGTVRGHVWDFIGNRQGLFGDGEAVLNQYSIDRGTGFVVLTDELKRIHFI